MQKRFCRLAVEEKSNIFILCSKNTIEENWLRKSLFYLDDRNFKYWDVEEMKEKIKYKYGK